ncbi:MAG: hypothetical protein K5879_11835 [Lachnospiraceae bacterium]|nr:hypothetical protein [Lachnospiraceae bacterium]
MNEENIKLRRVQKSCKAASIISKILFFCCMAGCGLALITGIVMIVNRESIDRQIEESAQQAKTEAKLPDEKVDIKMGPVTVASVTAEDIENGKLATAVSGRMTSDIPQVQEFFNENENSLSLVYGLYCITMSFMIGILTFALYFIHSAFAIIVKEGNPFADRVIKRILVSFIVISVVLAGTAGLGFGVLGGFLAWVVYTIMDYGRTLKIQSDETL